MLAPLLRPVLVPHRVLLALAQVEGAARLAQEGLDGALLLLAQGLAQEAKQP